MQIGIVGLGYWGPNLLRNFLGVKDVVKVIGCDEKLERLQAIRQKFPEVELTNSFEDLLKSEVDAIAIATPVDTHYHLAKKAIEAGKHIWVEKPFTSSVQMAEELIALAEEKNLKIFVDHTFIYTGAVRKMRELVASGEIGDIIYFDSVRINLGLFQHDINVMWDLVPHDLSIMNFLMPEQKVVAVTANGIANFYDFENIVHLSIHFENKKTFGHFHVNWTSPIKIRRIIVGGTKKMMVFDDMENSEKLKVYDCGVEVGNTESLHNALVQYRIGDMYSPKIIQTEALALGAQELINAIKENRQPLTSGMDGLNVVKILEAADISLKNRGERVELKDFAHITPIKNEEKILETNNKEFGKVMGL